MSKSEQKNSWFPNLKSKINSNNRIIKTFSIKAICHWTSINSIIHWTKPSPTTETNSCKRKLKQTSQFFKIEEIRLQSNLRQRKRSTKKISERSSSREAKSRKKLNRTCKFQSKSWISKNFNWKSREKIQTIWKFSHKKAFQSKNKATGSLPNKNQWKSE